MDNQDDRRWAGTREWSSWKTKKTMQTDNNNNNNNNNNKNQANINVKSRHHDTILKAKWISNAKIWFL